VPHVGHKEAYSDLMLLVEWQGIWPVKLSGEILAWYSVQGANDLHMVQLMPLPPHHLLLQ